MAEKRRLVLGCVADDFTGGSDAASFLALGGMRTILCGGIPADGFVLPEDCEAVVIALKSRTQETGAAVRDSLQAVQRLRELGAKRFYFKYCSTFDSTPKGNIGPVTDAIMEELGVRRTLLCPALPANGRTVRGGILCVNGVPLAESPMRNHPLTPMWESRVAALMAPQGKYASLEIHAGELRGEREAVLRGVDAFAAGKERCYLIPDYCDDSDAQRIVDLFGDMTFMTGGSGILTALARRLTGSDGAAPAFAGTGGRAVIVAGSCSVATRSQTLWYEAHGGKSFRLTDEGLLSGTETAASVWERARETGGDAPLIYSYDTPEGLAKKRGEAGKALSALVEQTLAGVAAAAYAGGCTRIIAAGGETSGAVTQRLGFRSFWIGESIAPGVPILIPLENPNVRLVLKSGNFGQEDFFGRALKLTGTQQ